MPLCANCVKQGKFIDMFKVQMALPELYPNTFPAHARNKALENTLNFDARECPRCKMQVPLEGWANWNSRKRLTKRQWLFLEGKVPGYPDSAF